MAKIWALVFLVVVGAALVQANKDCVLEKFRDLPIECGNCDDAVCFKSNNGNTSCGCVGCVRNFKVNFAHSPKQVVFKPGASGIIDLGVGMCIPAPQPAHPAQHFLGNLKKSTSKLGLSKRSIGKRRF